MLMKCHETGKCFTGSRLYWYQRYQRRKQELRVSDMVGLTFVVLLIGSFESSGIFGSTASSVFNVCKIRCNTDYSNTLSLLFHYILLKPIQVPGTLPVAMTVSAASVQRTYQLELQTSYQYLASVPTTHLQYVRKSTNRKGGKWQTEGGTSGFDGLMYVRCQWNLQPYNFALHLQFARPKTAKAILASFGAESELIERGNQKAVNVKANL
jgi:hypothetical protein